MLIATLAVAAALAAQQPSNPQEVPVLNAKLGDCSADFTVTDSTQKPVYNATIHVRVRYGVLSIKRTDLEVGTNSDGKARIEGLPAKAKPLVYDVRKDDKKAAVNQDVSTACHGMFDVGLK
jgi:hypothetical protein